MECQRKKRNKFPFKPWFEWILH